MSKQQQPQAPVVLKKGSVKNLTLSVPSFSQNAWGLICKMFGQEKVLVELQKFAGPEALKKFASNPDAQTNDMRNPIAENKEVFDGQQYLNKPPGEREVVGQEPGKDKTVTKNKGGWDRTIRIAKRYGEKRIVIGEVYVPYDPADPSTIDTHGHACTAEAIEKAAYAFMEQLKNGNIDVQHNFFSGYGTVVESYIAKEGDPLFKAGTWVVGVKVTDEKVWDKIQKGDITGFSLAGSARLTDPSEVTSSMQHDGGSRYE